MPMTTSLAASLVSMGALGRHVRLRGLLRSFCKPNAIPRLALHFLLHPCLPHTLWLQVGFALAVLGVLYVIIALFIIVLGAVLVIVIALALVLVLMLVPVVGFVLASVFVVAWRACSGSYG